MDDTAGADVKKSGHWNGHIGSCREHRDAGVSRDLKDEMEEETE